MPQNPLVLCLAIPLAVAACGTTTAYTPTNTPPRQMTAKAPSSVEVFTTGAPQKDYVEVGIIEAQQSSEFSTDQQSDIIASLRAEAAKQGCDAIVITDNNNATVGQVVEGDGYTDTLKGYRGACLVYR